ncbi:VapE domain-containing protein [Chitinophaga sp. GbtcB8]|uniref:VapE domain-containing protein n=1 Tax=Chitinophaga sp. GbtcB8 TaxID=2824753 RepID=UPI001C305F2A|nr:VapE domain-containing protein [Chitinophaga sp. GbtcB8]
MNKDILISDLTLLTPDLGAGKVDGGNQSMPQNDNMGNEGKQIALNSQELIAGREEPEQLDQQNDHSSLEMVERHLTEHYDFRYNAVSSRLEFKKKIHNQFELLSDYKLNSIIRELGKRHIKVSSQNLRSIIHSDYTPIYDPFVSYFNNLPEWDGRTDYIGQLAETVRTTNNELWTKWFKKWLVATVGCATNDAIINHTAIVFIGKQGAGKTTWMHKLQPQSLKGYYFSGIPNLRNKDAKIRLAECFLINLDELDSLSKANTERLKEIITAFEVRERRPYAHYDENMPRRASFMGSVNNKQFLNDTTGNRRFLCVEVNEINFAHDINMDNVYSQALALFRAGFQYYFDSNDIEEVEEHNEQFQMVSYIEEMILKWFEPIDPEAATPSLKISATDIADYLAQKSSVTVTDANIQKVGRIMRKHNFRRIKSGGNYVYALKEKGERPQIVAA